MEAESTGEATPLVWAAALLVTLLLPFSLAGFRTFQLTVMASYAIAVVGLVIVVGYAGQISLGHGALVAVGAYTSAILRQRYGLPFELTLPLAGLAGALMACLIGIPALRLGGFHFAVITFLLPLVLPSVINRLDFLTGGTEGISLHRVRPPLDFGLSPDQWLYIVTVLIGALLLAVARPMLRGRTGRAFRSLRDNEPASIAFGVGPAYHKTLAFALSGIFAGVAGGVIVSANGYVGPGSFDLAFSLALLTAAVIGGLESLAGAAAGAAFIYFLPLLVVQWMGGLNLIRTSGIPAVAYGVLIIAVMFVAPGGLAGLVKAGYARLRRLREMAEAVAAET